MISVVFEHNPASYAHQGVFLASEEIAGWTGRVEQR